MSTWSKHFGASKPTLDIIPCIDRGLAPYDGKIEINVIAAKPGSAAKKQHIDAGVATAFLNQPQAVKAGDLLFTSGLMAIDSDGLIAGAVRDQRQPHFSSPARGAGRIHRRQHREALRGRRHVARQCLRVLMFLTDIREFFPVYRVWEQRLGGRPVPFSAVEVPGPLPVPGATMQIEAWAYAP